ncbi:MAG: MBL fold metallo-hydrolase [Flavobacteriales bacterium]|nr:MBL fold metallo-hydrolase [Flavobacteriales bacterium]
MKIEQIYTGCLSQGAYYIESNGEAAVIDPLREIDAYVKKAQAHGARIKFIFETHFHADFVSGHLDLAKKTGAVIIYGPGAATNYKVYNAKDGEEFELGNVKIRALHTPGHTLESTTYLLIDENQKPHCIFTGDTLFIGDVGRPDLAIKQNLTQQDLAGMLYDSLRSKIMTLPDDVIVYPAHGAGSACGKHMSKETWDTLGNQKKTNYALRAISKDQFIAEVCKGNLPPPQYFAKNALINKTGYQSLDIVLKRGYVPLSTNEFEQIANHENALVLDTRSAQEFAEGHIPNSIFIGLDGSFAPWVGALITDLTQPILFTAPEGMEKEVVVRLSRVGYDNTIGYLEGGMEAWKKAGKEIETVESIPAQKFVTDYSSRPLNVLDVRKPDEFENGHVENAENTPLDFINDELAHLSKDKTYHVHCAGGYRSMIFLSILQARGFEKLVNVEGGFGAISKLPIPVITGTPETP